MANPDYQEDSLYRHAKREAKIILASWVICLAYTVSVCYLYGYLSHEPLGDSVGPDIATLLGPLGEFDREAESLTFPLGLGMPDWVVYGVVIPWLACIVFTIWFCTFYFREDELEEPHPKVESGS